MTSHRTNASRHDGRSRPRIHGVAQMKIRLKVFARLREICGFEEKELTVSAGITVGDILLELKRIHSGLAAVEKNLLFAVNQEYCGPDTVLSDGDTLAIFPLVSGG